jgi:hypothetical protein
VLLFALKVPLMTVKLYAVTEDPAGHPLNASQVTVKVCDPFGSFVTVGAFGVPIGSSRRRRSA